MLAAVAAVPAALMSAAPQTGAIKYTHVLRIAQQPLSIGVKVATVTRPLDLGSLTNADFGDDQQIR